ncbi:MAG TPA: carboxypeptidase-like regulatory domain-containing protein [Flavisolibacter sp.]|jgi:hypothetical protein|nr:carboxypeptidase-like regulatory domain-containing protein [Flavisolibacter sp.]
MKFKLLLLTAIFSSLAFLAQAKSSPPGTGEEGMKNDIVGGVFHAETKKPLSSVSVTAYSSNKKEKIVITDNNGTYSFNELKPGTYKLVFEKDGFKKVVKEKVTIRSDEAFQMNVEMDETGDFQLMPGLLFTDFD